MKLLKSLFIFVIVSSIITACHNGGANQINETNPVLKNELVNELSIKLDGIDELDNDSKIEVINQLVFLADKINESQQDKLYLQYANAVYFDEFGNSPEVIKAIASSIGQISINDSYTQYLIAKAVQEGKFGNNQNIINILANSLSNMRIKDSDTQNVLVIAFNNGIFGNDKDFWRFIMKNWSISHDIDMKWSWLLS